MNYINFSNNSNIRAILTLSLLSGKATSIQNITPKLTDSEGSFLRILAAISPSSKITISTDGQKITLEPGTIDGGDLMVECRGDRSLGYYLEYTILILLFAKYNSKLVLIGPTHTNTDLSVDYISEILIQQLNYFTNSESIQLQIVSRAFPGNNITATGKIVLNVTPVVSLKSVQYTKPSGFKQISGNLLSINIPPQFAQRVLTKVKQNLNYVGNININFDSKQNKSVISGPGYGAILVGETLDAGKVAAELYSLNQETADPEHIANTLTSLFCQEVKLMGAVDSYCQELILLTLALTDEDVNYVRTGQLTSRSLILMRVVEQFFNIQYQIEQFTINNVLQGCNICVRGAGIKNIGRRGF